jgi:Tol biopolymer transport system component
VGMKRSTRFGFGLCASLVLLSSQPIAAAPDPSEWSEPVNLGPLVNSAFADEGPAISEDGLSLYFTSTRPGGFGGQDIWVAQRHDRAAAWGAPVNLGPTVNTAANENAPAFSRDGHRMFFVSNRAGGVGGLDIWVSFREHRSDDFGWQAPGNVGAPVNTASNDAGPGWSREGGEEVLFFTSNRPGGSGGADIYVSARQTDGSYGPAVPVVELNTAAQDARAAVRHDGREVFLFSNRAGSLGATDLWTSTRQAWRAPWSTPVNLGSGVNSLFEEMQPAISGDARTLFFASNRPGGEGQLDLYMITRTSAD